jgi:hypothetical protein
LQSPTVEDRPCAMVYVPMAVERSPSASPPPPEEKEAEPVLRVKTPALTLPKL